jgi:sodium/hydrogen antiporter
MAFLSHGSPLSGADFAKLGLDLFILGPGAGILVGLLGVAALDLIRRRIGVRRDYESLYSLGVAFTAFAAAEAVHGSGFLAAFAAGMTIAALDVELCDCFIEYGGVTAEMLLLFTFVLLGSYVIWTGFTVINGATLLFTAIAVLIRTPVYLLSLIKSSVDMRGRLLIAWFGPRGLSSLLLVLLPVFAGLPGGEQLFAICSLVVLVSVVLHGGAPMLLAQAARSRARREGAGIAGGAVGVTPAPGPAAAQEGARIDREAPREEQPVAPISRGDSTTSSEDEGGGSINATTSRRLGAEGGGAQVGSQKISLDELRRLWQLKEPVTILDVRTERSFDEDDLQAKGAARMPPDHVAERAKELGLKKEAWLVAYCA